MRERHLRSVPPPVWLGLIAGLVFQIMSASQFKATPNISELHSPPSAEFVRLMSLDDNITAARLLDLWLQAYDYQPGISIPFNQLNYDKIIEWLDLTIQLDPRNNYPLLVATHIYASVNDGERTRKMLDFVERKYREDPEHRWRWLANAAITAKHRLKDLPLALRYATTLAEHAGEKVPYWARDIRIIILADMGEKEAARLIIGGLLQNGQITDPYELHFLKSRLEELQ